MRVFAILGFTALGSMAAVKAFGILPCALTAVLLLSAALLIRRNTRRAAALMLVSASVLLCCAVSRTADDLTVYHKQTVDFKAVAVGFYASDELLSIYDVRVTEINGHKVDADARLTCDGHFSDYEIISGTGTFWTANGFCGLHTESPIAGHGIERSVSYYASRVRNAVKRRVGNVLTGRCGDLFNGMMFGESDRISAPERLTFARAGISHIFSVSGLHIAVLNGFILCLFLPFGVSPRRRALLGVAAVVPLALFAGLSRSVVRALVMVICINAGRFAKREYDSLNALGLAVFIILMFDPCAYSDVSFLLTVFATLGIIVFLPRLSDIIEGFPTAARPIAGSAAITLSATVATFPIMLMYFDEFSLIGFAVNAILSPVIAILLPLCLVLSAAASVPFLDFVARLLGHICMAMFEFIRIVCHVAVKLPFAYLPLGFNFVRIWYIIAIVAFVIAFKLRRKIPCARLIAAAVSICVLAAGVFADRLTLKNSVQFIPIRSTYASALLILNDSESILVAFGHDRWLDYEISSKLRASGIRDLTIVARYPSAEGVLPDDVGIGSVWDIVEANVNKGCKLNENLSFEVVSISGEPSVRVTACGERVAIPRRSSGITAERVISPDTSFEAFGIKK